MNTDMHGSIRERLDYHLSRAKTCGFHANFTTEDRAKFAQHAPRTLSAFDSGASIENLYATVSADFDRLTGALRANGGKLSAEGSYVREALGDLQHVLLAESRAQRLADDLTAQRVGVNANGAPVWRHPDGTVVQTFGPRDSLAAGQRAPDGVDLGTVIRAMVTGRGLQEVNAALAGGSVSTGGALVPTELASQIIDRMRAASVVVQAGGLTIPMPARAYSFAKITGDPTVSWAAEGADLAAGDPSFGTVTLTAKTLRGWCKVSRELVEDGVGLGDALNMAFGGAMALELDRAALVGSGSGSEPLGIGAASGGAPVTTMAANGAQLTSYDKLLDLLEVLQTANAPAPTAMIYAPRTGTVLAKLKDTSNQPLQVPPALAAIPRLVTTSMPITQSQGTSNNASSIVMGDFSKMLIGVRSELQIVRAESINTNEVVLGFVLRADVAWQHAAAFAQLRGIIP